MFAHIIIHESEVYERMEVKQFAKKTLKRSWMDCNNSSLDIVVGSTTSSMPAISAQTLAPLASSLQLHWLLLSEVAIPTEPTPAYDAKSLGLLGTGFGTHRVSKLARTGCI